MNTKGKKNYLENNRRKEKKYNKRMDRLGAAPNLSTFEQFHWPHSCGQ